MAISLKVLDDKAIGIIIYEGPSAIDDEPIVVIANGFKKSGNRKTGKETIQTWIIRQDIAPVDALAEGEDYSVCGDCFHRHARSCYVNPMHGPTQVYNAYHNGSYVKATPEALEAFRGQYVRFGSYGDPAAVPVSVWRSIAEVADRWTGYTHAWRNCDPELKHYCMASCDLEDEVYLARKKGFKPFYVRQEGEPIPAGMFVCPASDEAGKKRTCADCTACQGGEYRERQGTPTLLAHGVSWKKKYFNVAMKARKNKKAYTYINHMFNVA